MRILLCTALLLRLGGLCRGRRRPRLWLTLTVAGTWTWLRAALCVPGTGIAWALRGSMRLGGEAVHSCLAALNACFLALGALVTLGGLGATWSKP